MSALGTDANPLRVAVIGGGPSGFYATEALLKSDSSMTIDMFDRLPAPYGLVRNGVAPDHPKLKQAILVYDKVARSNPEYAFFGNVNIGQDITIDELRTSHHAVIFTCGAETDRRLGIPGEDLPGSHTATEFVGWYNGHPDYRDREFDLSHETAAIIGQGNVAADVARILAKSVDELKITDISQHALEVLAESQIREIHVIGRRGPAQAKFTNKELREFNALANCDSLVDPADLELDPESTVELAPKSSVVNQKNVDLFGAFAEDRPLDRARRCRFEFLKSPVELRGGDRLETLVLEKNRLAGEPFNLSARGTGERVELECGLLFRSIGYRGVPIPAVPFDANRGVFPNRAGRLVDAQAATIPALYAAGWIKRGPTGIIGTNRADAVETVTALLADLAHLDSTAKPGGEALRSILRARGVRFVTYPHWQHIDAAEVARGEPKGKPREKFTRVDEMLATLEETG